MNRREEQELNDWLEGCSNKLPTDENLREEWQIQSVIDTLLQMQEGELSLSEDFHEKLRARIEKLQNEKPDEEAAPTKKKRKTVQSANRRLPLDWRPVVGAVAAILLILLTVAIMQQPRELGIFQRLQAVFSGSSVYASGSPMATVDHLDGRAHIGDADNAVELAVGAIIGEGARVVCPPGNNRLRVRIYGGVTLDVDAGTSFHLRSKGDNLLINVNEGQVTAETTLAQSIVLKSPLAEVSTSDALISLSLQPDSARVTVNEGSAAFRNLITNELQTLSTGETLVATEGSKSANDRMKAAKMSLPTTGRYLLLPIGGPHNFVQIDVADQRVHALDVNLATSEAAIQWWSYLDLDKYQGQTATVTINGSRDRATTEAMLNLLDFADQRPTSTPAYGEAFRPQLSFSQLRGRAGNPSGLTYYKGEYHLFWPATIGSLDRRSRNHWGHAVSTDLIRWREQAHALRPSGGAATSRLPDAAIGSCWPGSAHVDVDNLAGWNRFDDEGGQHPAMVAAYTDPAIGGIAIAYSTDRGRNWQHHAGNPVIRHSGRDPKLLWHPAGQRWLIVVADDGAAPDYKDPGLAFYASKNLRDWTPTGRLPGIFRSPDMFELNVTNDKNERHWVLTTHDGRYWIGNFDGNSFSPAISEAQRLHWGNAFAPQTFSNSPDGRVIQVAGVHHAPMEMPIRNGFSLPMRLSLRRTTDGLRLFANPIREIDRLRYTQPVLLEPQVLRSDNDKPLEIDAPSETLDLLISVRNKDAKRLTIDFAGAAVQYDFQTQALKFGTRTVYDETFDAMPLPSQDGRINFRLLLDRGTYHLIGGNGRCYAIAPRNTPGETSTSTQIRLSAEDGTLNLESLEAHPLRSIWR